MHTNNLTSLYSSNSYRKEKDKLKIIPKAGHWLALGMKLQNEVISNQKQPSCKKACCLQKSQGEKDVKSKVAAKKWL